jgi:hypothetical protein
LHVIFAMVSPVGWLVFASHQHQERDTNFIFTKKKKFCLSLFCVNMLSKIELFFSVCDGRRHLSLDATITKWIRYTQHVVINYNTDCWSDIWISRLLLPGSQISFAIQSNYSPELFWLRPTISQTSVRQLILIANKLLGTFSSWTVNYITCCNSVYINKK